MLFPSRSFNTRSPSNNHSRFSTQRMANRRSPTPPQTDARSANHAVNYVLENRFYVEMESQITASFSSCQGLSAKMTTTTIREGGVNDQQRIFLGPTKFTEVILSRGMTDNLLFWNWMQGALTGGRGLRRNINILTFNQAGETMQCWTLMGAVPITWKAPGFKADGSNVAVEEITIAFEGLKVTARAGGGGADEQVTRDRMGYFGS